MPLTGRITEWQADRGYGYLDCDGGRVFLHIRDFKERRKEPVPGDVIHFDMGTDRQGRPCAKEAVHANVPGQLRSGSRGREGRIRPGHILIFVFLILPGYAVYRRYGENAVEYAGAWVLLISVWTYQVYANDKRQALNKGQRESEAWLHCLEVFGGWPGAFFAQRKVHHKIKKLSYQLIFWMIILLHQLVAFDSLRGWWLLRSLARLVEKLE